MTATWRLNCGDAAEKGKMQSAKCKSKNATRRGLTLVEMVVVLLILSLLTVAAVQSLSPVADQARYEATSHTLTQLNESMLGADGLRQSDGTPLVSGFVADVGRVPILQGADAETQLRELWETDTV